MQGSGVDVHHAMKWHLLKSISENPCDVPFDASSVTASTSCEGFSKLYTEVTKCRASTVFRASHPALQPTKLHPLDAWRHACQRAWRVTTYLSQGALIGFCLDSAPLIVQPDSYVDMGQQDHEVNSLPLLASLLPTPPPLR